MSRRGFFRAGGWHIEKDPRKTGIDVLDAIPSGSHICLFYETSRDLLSTLVPFFKAGLENNELCVWAFPDILDDEQCGRALRRAIPGFAQYQARGQMETMPSASLYLSDGTFDARKVLDGWASKLGKVTERGYAGMRTAGDTGWVGKRDKRKFAEYEEAVNDTISGHNMIAICSYNLGRYSPPEVLDISLHHEFTLFKRAGSRLVLKSEPGKISPSAGEAYLARLQKRFLASGFEGMDDADIIELVMGLCLPADEAKKLAQAAIKEFQSLMRFMSASRVELRRAGLTPTCIFFVQLLKQLPSELLRQQIVNKPVYGSSREVFDYLHYSMRDLKIEIFKVIFLDNSTHIIDVADLSSGTVDSAPVRPREIMEAAINASATNLIFVHNHPSGDPTPSRLDRRLTRDLVFMGRVMQIKVLDHIIIGANSHFSFADERFIQKYEDEFMNLKIRMNLAVEG